MRGTGEQTMELKRDLIIKALECFHQRILDTDLAKKVYEAEITAIIDAIALIKELTEENERLRKDRHQWTKMWEDNQRRWKNEYRKLKIENEMLLTHIPIPKEMLEDINEQ